MNEKNSLVLAWASTGAGWIMHNISTVAVLVATIIAALSSYYSWRINRRKDQQLRADAERKCEACRLTFNPFACPYPEDERPSDCWAKRKEKDGRDTKQDH